MKKAITVTVLVLLVHICNAQPSIEHGLKLYYPFENVFTSIVFDESGNGNSGYRYNAYSYYDRFGRPDNALRFNGYSSMVFFEADSLLLDEYSYCAWISNSGIPDYGKAGFILDIGSFYGVDQYIAYTNQYSLYTLDGVLAQGYHIDGSSSWISQDELYNIGEWKFVVYTRSQEIIKLYIDGELIDSLEVDGAVPIYGEYPKGYIGCRNTMEQYFEGAIDDVRIYDYPISIEIVEELYNEGVVDVTTVDESVLKVFPNPTSDYVNIRLPSEIRNYQIDIYNGFGHHCIFIANQSRVSVNNLSDGLYYLKVSSQEMNYVEVVKFVVY